MFVGFLVTPLPVDTGRKLNVHKTFNLRPVSTPLRISTKMLKDMKDLRFCKATLLKSCVGMGVFL